MQDTKYEDAHYWHVLFDVVCLMKEKGYNKVLDDVDTLLLKQDEQNR